VSRTTAVPTPAVVPAAHHAPLALATRAHHAVLRAGDGGRLRRLRDDRGQGTVEYVALAMLIAAVMAGVVVAAGGMSGKGIADAVVEKVKAAISSAGTKK
jgi:Flp pilus assembly pilin Flp